MVEMNAQKDLPDPLTAEALAEGQAKTPSPLLDFFRMLYAGSDTPNEHIELKLNQHVMMSCM